jgi:excisionase family DNA binding protein
LEAMRLCDVDGLSQEEAGERMGVSRGTVQRLLKRGRAKVVRALVGSQAILIEKGENDENLRSD